MLTEDELTARAMRYYRRHCERNGFTPTQPAALDSGFERHHGNEFVALRNGNGLLAVYQVMPGDRLCVVRDPSPEFETH